MTDTTELNPLFLNRMVLMLRPRQAFLEWLQSADPESSMPITLEILNEDRNVWLIPPMEEPEEAQAWVMARWRALLELELSDWLTEPDLWPEPLTRETFSQFFSIEVHSIVQDLAEIPIEYEDWEE